MAPRYPIPSHRTVRRSRWRAAHLTRYHGVFAPASPDRAQVVPRTRTIAATERGEVSVSDGQRAMSWAQGLKRVFATPQGAFS